MKQKLICKDYTVSGKEFELIYNSELEMYSTHPQPSEKDLPSYYKSDAYISHTDSTKSLFDKVYQLVKRYALTQKLNLINSFQTESKTLLDVGCGTGDFIHQANKNKWNVVGIEPNEKARILVRKKINDNKTIFSSFNELQKTHSHQFDVITLWHVLEHVSNLDEYIKELKALLKPNGFLVVAVPNFKSFDAEHYKEFWAAYDVPRHLWHFSQKAIQLVFKKQEMKVINILPMKFDSYYVSLLSEKHKTEKSNIFSAFHVGFKSNWKAKSSKEYSSLIYIIKKD